MQAWGLVDSRVVQICTSVFFVSDGALGRVRNKLAFIVFVLLLWRSAKFIHNCYLLQVIL